MAFKRKPPLGNVRRAICLENNFRGVTTNKQGRLIQFESEQERKLVLLLERDPTVTDFISQPEIFHFCDDKGTKRHYTPDFKVWRSNGEIELHEVTIEARRKAQKSVPQREIAAQAICQERGWRYIIHTEETLPSGYEYANLNFLAAFRGKIHINKEITYWWMNQLNSSERHHPRSVLLQFCPSSAETLDPIVNTGLLLNGLYYLLWHGAIEMEWNQPFIWRGDFHHAARIWLLEKSVALTDGIRMYAKEDCL